MKRVVSGPKRRAACAFTNGFMFINGNTGKLLAEDLQTGKTADPVTAAFDNAQKLLQGSVR
jgi:hypothetical protein